MVRLSLGFQFLYFTSNNCPEPMVGCPVTSITGGKAELFSGNNSTFGTLTSVPLYRPTRVVVILFPEKVKVASLTIRGPNVLVNVIASTSPGTVVSVVATSGIVRLKNRPPNSRVSERSRV